MDSQPSYPAFSKGEFPGPEALVLSFPAHPKPEATVWPLSAQVVAAVLMASTLIALAWNSYLGSYRATKPTRVMRLMDSTRELEVVDDEKTSDEPLAVPPMTAKALPAPAAPISKMTERDAPLDLNTATVVQLQRLPGVGPAMAERISSRRTRQPFRSVEDLRGVSGIGTKTLDKLRPFVTVAAPKIDSPTNP
jgi:competence ComEA-like helix-hairpin-helix protein